MRNSNLDDAAKMAASFPLPAGTRLVSAVLYGSVARGWATPQSDIDVALVFDHADSGTDDISSAIKQRETQALLPDGTHIEFNLYHVREIEAMLSKQDALDTHPRSLNALQVRTLDDLHHGRALINATWLEAFASRAAPGNWAKSAAYHHSVTCHTLYRDTLGFLETDAFVAAASTGRRLAEAAYDWLCAINGDPCMRGKWRYARHAARQDSPISEQVCMARLSALQLPDRESSPTWGGALAADCIRLFQYVADLDALIQGASPVAPEWLASVAEHMLAPRSLRSPRHYMTRRGEALVILENGLPRYALEADVAHAWLLLGMATPSDPLISLLGRAGFEMSRAQEIGELFASNNVALGAARPSLAPFGDDRAPQR